MDRRFSVSSAYNHLMNNQSPFGSNCRAIWKWHGPERTRSFLWLAKGNHLLTNSCRMHRHMSNMNLCPRCGASSETCLHALRDCLWVTQLWLSIVHPLHRNLFFSLPLESWIRRNISGKLGTVTDQDWALEFGITCWMIWRYRNNLIFEQSHDSAFKLLHEVKSFKRNFQEAHNFLTSGRVLSGSLRKPPSSWSKPERDGVKINVDGSCTRGGSSTGCGGVLSVSDGNWILGLMNHLGCGCTLMAELWAIVLGLELAWSQGFRKVVIEGDSLTAVELITRGCHQSQPYAFLVNRASHLLDREWETRITFSPRETNLVADWLAKNSHYAQEMQFLFMPSNGCRHLVLSDLLSDLHPAQAC